MSLCEIALDEMSLDIKWNIIRKMSFGETALDKMSFDEKASQGMLSLDEMWFGEIALDKMSWYQVSKYDLGND